MTRVEQMLFVLNLCNGVAQSLTMMISREEIPEEWDGHELRELLADTFARERGEVLKDHRSLRYREYEQVALKLPRF